MAAYKRKPAKETPGAIAGISMTTLSMIIEKVRIRARRAPLQLTATPLHSGVIPGRTPRSPATERPASHVRGHRSCHWAAGSDQAAQWQLRR